MKSSENKLLFACGSLLLFGALMASWDTKSHSPKAPEHPAVTIVTTAFTLTPDSSASGLIVDKVNAIYKRWRATEDLSERHVLASQMADLVQDLDRRSLPVETNNRIQEIRGAE